GVQGRPRVWRAGGRVVGEEVDVVRGRIAGRSGAEEIDVVAHVDGSAHLGEEVDVVARSGGLAPDVGAGDRIDVSGSALPERDAAAPLVARVVRTGARSGAALVRDRLEAGPRGLRLHGRDGLVA